MESELTTPGNHPDCAPDTVGCIFDVQRFSIHDGPGIRTTVFLKGCPMSCIWCHNPESRSSEPELAFYVARCIGCWKCLEVCPDGAILGGDERIDRSLCRLCGECAAVCPPEALQMIGRNATVAEVVDEVMRDLPFYETSGGGVTLSGGEPFHQFDYTLCLLRTFKANGLHTAVETCGLTTGERLAACAQYTDLFLYDLKAIDPKRHEHSCGTDNAVVLENARWLVESGAEVVFRAPIIPGCNDLPEDIRLLGEFMLSLPGRQKLELMPYHHIGTGKYRALGMPYPLDGLKPHADLDEVRRTLAAMGVELVSG